MVIHVNACLKECTELKFFMDKLTVELHLKKVSVQTELGYENSHISLN